MHPASTASLRVASSSFAVMKMTGHFVPDAASRRCSSIPEIPPRWMSSSRQVPICALPLSSNASAEANVRLSMPLCANSRATPFRKPCGVRIEGQSSQVEVGLFVCSCAGAAGVAEIVATPTRISLYGDGERCGYPRSAGCATIYRCFRGGYLRGADYDQKHSYQSCCPHSLYFCRFGRASDSSSPRDECISQCERVSGRTQCGCVSGPLDGRCE